MTTILIYYLLSVNLATFIAYGIDKLKARRNGALHNKRHLSRRIPEVALLLLAALGGSPAALLAMYLFRHKTLHNKFRFGVPIIMLMQILAAFAIIYLASGTSLR